MHSNKTNKAPAKPMIEAESSVRFHLKTKKLENMITSVSENNVLHILVRINVATPSKTRV